MNNEYFDLYQKIREDPQFVEYINKRIVEIDRLERTSGPQNRIDELTLDILRVCQNNFGLLVPYVFPTYIEGKPMSLMDRPFGFAMMNYSLGTTTTIRASRQIGKALAAGEPVLTPKGWVPIGHLRPGQLVYSETGEETVVTGVFHQGVKKLFCMVFTDGSNVVCCDEHLWKCKLPDEDRWQVRSLKEIKALPGGNEPKLSQAIRIPLCGAVNFEKKDRVIPAYKQGVLLSQSRLPDDALFDSIENRWELLRGLMDRGGGLSENGIPEFHTENYQQAEDLQRLVESLGATATVESVDSEGFSLEEFDGPDAIIPENEEDVEEIEIVPEDTPEALDRAHALVIALSEAYEEPVTFRVRLGHLTANPFKVHEHAQKFKPCTKERTRILEGIYPVRPEHAVCISVASKHKTFITRHNIVTHNSTSIGSRILMLAHFIPGLRQLFVVPHSDHLSTFANRLIEMEQDCRFKVRSGKYKQNMHYKAYPNKSVVELIRVYTDAKASRGKTTDFLYLDEAQHFDPSNWGELQQTQKSSSYPMTLFSGTSLTVNTFLEARYQESSQDSWHIRTDHVNKTGNRVWLDFGDKDDIIPCLREQGLFCPYTNKRLDVTQGQFVSKFPDQLSWHRGLHIPQIIVPDISLSPIKWMDIWGPYNKYDINTFLQEILGIPTQEGEREISEKDLQNICTLPSKDTLKEGASRGKYRCVVSGCDWGGSDYNPATKSKTSYTLHAILGVTYDGFYDILHFRRYSGMGYKEIIGQIVMDHLSHGGTAIATDFGVGHLYNTMLREHEKLAADRHIIFDYTGPRAAMVAPPKNSNLFNMLMLNKTESITSLYSAIKGTHTQGPRLRCYPWEESSNYLLDFLNLFRVQSENTATGSTKFRYVRHGKYADDALHAVNFAYQLGRLIVGEPLMEDWGTLRKLQQQIQGGWTGSGPAISIPKPFSG